MKFSIKDVCLQRKRIYFMMAMVCILIFILCISLLSASRFGGANNSPLIPDSAIQYRLEPRGDGDAIFRLIQNPLSAQDWLPFTHHINSKEGFFWIRISSSVLSGEDARLFLYPIPNYYEVYQNGKRTFTHGSPKTIDLRKDFLHWNMVSVPSTSEDIFIRMQGRAPSMFATGTVTQLLTYVFKSDIVDMMNALGLLVVGLISLLLYLYKRTPRLLLYYALFVMVHFSIWPVFSYLFSKQLIFDFPGYTNFYLANMLEVLDITLLLLLFREVTHSVYRKTVLRLIFLLLAAGLSFIVAITVNPSSAIVFAIFGVLVSGSCIFILVVTILSLRREKSNELILFVSGLAVFLLLEILLNVSVSFAMVEIKNTIKLLLPFTIILPGAAIIMRRYLESEFQVIAYADELKQLTLQLERDNRLLEQRVSDRTKDLEETYQKLVDSMKESAAAEVEIAALEERNRIAQEIHDIVGHTLTTTIIQIEAGKRLIGQNPQQAVDRMDTSQKLVRKGLDEIRSSVRLLKDAEWNYDLETSLRNVIQDMRDNADVDIDSRIAVLPDLTMMQKNAIYMALKEGLTNGVKHGKCSKFLFILQHNDENIFFSLKNNGEPVQPERFGFGLQSMATRINNLQGTMRISSGNDWNCVLDICFPLRSP
ncbi:histidine kinase [Neobacillus mesonae]|uniref:sensor histidine kinase n=1 Tax=Neobacillus mesonae TaxID=1193713 RepID=UPI00203EE0C4|nr:histidine kinase [Neobacillus mesonae]MCM3568639.1 histidine kinase [Neobacillus mesonae]